MSKTRKTGGPLASLSLAATLCAAPAAAESMQIMKKNGSRASMRGPEANFTGTPPRIDPLFAGTEQTGVTAGLVTFEPGTRSAWHTHPAGQLLIVNSGVGWIQEWNGERHEIRPGDVIWTPPGVKHWHGASATNTASILSIQENVDGRNVDWMEKVSAQQYGK